MFYDILAINVFDRDFCIISLPGAIATAIIFCFAGSLEDRFELYVLRCYVNTIFEAFWVCYAR